VEEVIDYEIDYFGKLNRGFEWKVYSHDDPSDLLARLRLRGFAIGEEEGFNDPRFGGVAASPASAVFQIFSKRCLNGNSHRIALEKVII
jgi:hypothetical protein